MKIPNFGYFIMQKKLGKLQKNPISSNYFSKKNSTQYIILFFSIVFKNKMVWIDSSPPPPIKDKENEVGDISTDWFHAWNHK